jgi:hypothetical protein
VAARNPPCARPSLAGFNEAIRIIQNFSASRHIGGIYSLRKHSAQFPRRSPSARAFSVLTSTARASTALFLLHCAMFYIYPPDQSSENAAVTHAPYMAKLKILAAAKVAGNLTNLLGINIKERRDRKSIKALRVTFSQWRYQPFKCQSCFIARI